MSKNEVTKYTEQEVMDDAKRIRELKQVLVWICQ